MMKDMKIKSLKKELAAGTAQLQKLEAALDAVLAEKAELESQGADLEAQNARLRAMVLLALGEPATKAKEPVSRSELIENLSDDVAGTALALAGAMRPLLADRTAATVLNASIRYSSNLSLSGLRLEQEVGDAPPNDIDRPVPIGEYLFQEYARFSPVENDRHRAILIRPAAKLKSRPPFRSIELSFIARLGGYRGLAVQYRDGSEDPFNTLALSSAPWGSALSQRYGVRAPICEFADLGEDWGWLRLSLPLRGSGFPDLALVPLMTEKYEGQVATPVDDRLSIEIGEIALDINGEDGPQLGSEGNGSTASTPFDTNANFQSLAFSSNRDLSPSRRLKNITPGDAMPARPVRKGRLLSSNQAEKMRERRERQIADFQADGEASRIEALRDKHIGERAFIIGNGPSLTSQDLSLLKDEITFAANWFVNHDEFDAVQPTYYTIASHEMFGGWDEPSPELNPDFLAKLTAHQHRPEMFFSHRFRDHITANDTLASYDSRYLIFDQPKFMADEVGGVQYDLGLPMNDAYTVLLTFCVPLAVHMGITQIYMVGCDCDYGVTSPEDTGPRKYFYAPSDHKTSSTKASSIFRIWADGGPIFQVYRKIFRQLSEHEIGFFNATAGGRLNVLPRVTFEGLF
ncbi:MAG: hypothetical protein ACTS1Z_01515 [Parasphingopyxis sp.]|uniref:hypothetical protein n=1 Tax=Parasphingopyxis sp. TaxID=1920299 RepID=UPI003FA0DC8F